MSLAAARDAEGAHVRVATVGSLGLVTLDRPEALNALTLDMVRDISAALDGFERDSAVATVAIEGAGGRAFCAGGDIRAIYRSGRAGDGLAEAFWREEYRLVSRIAGYPKPFVALIDGLVMGGGVGISVHGRFRVVTERTKLAMPEVGIGFVPDVGATFILARAPGRAGAYVALTGETIGAADAIHVGFADFAVESAALTELKQVLASLDPDATAAEVEAALRRFASAPEPGPVEREQATIERVFGQDRVEQIADALARENSELGERTRASLAAKSPTSLKLALGLLERAASAASLDDCLAREFRVARRTLAGHDFYEGIRAAVIDKDRAPRWAPETLAAVDDDAIEAYFVDDGGEASRV